METRDLNPGEIVPEVNPTPAAAESLESENLVDNADAMKVAVEASDAQVNAEAVENAMSQKAFESELNTKDEVMTRLTELAKDEFVNVSREEIARLKQRFYALRKAEQEAEMAAWIAEGKDVQEFIPALDPTEEQFKALMNTLRERKAAAAAAEEEKRRENLERKLALIEELKTLSADTDNVNRAFPRVKEIQSEFKEIGEVPPPMPPTSGRTIRLPWNSSTTSSK